MTQVFDPTKPVSDKTVGGYPVQITERGQMLFGKVTDTDGVTREICWNIKGESPALNGDFNLQNTPAPAPAVDWEKPVRWKDTGMPIEVLHLFEENGNRRALIKWQRSREHGEYETVGLIDRASLAVENAPPPPRTITVEVAACEHKHFGRHMAKAKDGFIVIHSKPSDEVQAPRFGSQTFAEQNGWTFGPWQTLTLPLKGDDNG